MVGLEFVFGWPDVLGAVGEVAVVDGVGDAWRGLYAQQWAESAGPPAGFFLGFAGGGVGGTLAGLYLPDGDLPAPIVGDEPVSPQQQDEPALDGDATGARTRRGGPELTDPSRGGYDVDRVDLLGDDLAGIDLKPGALKEFIMANREALLAEAAVAG